MELKEELKILEEKLSSMEYYGILENKKREAELLGKKEEAKFLDEKIKEFVSKKEEKIKNKFENISEKFLDLLDMLGIEIPESEEEASKSEEEERKIKEKVEKIEAEIKEKERERERRKELIENTQKEEKERKTKEQVEKDEETEIKEKNSDFQITKTKKEFLRNGESISYEIEIDSHKVGEKIYHLLKIKMKNEKGIELRFLNNSKDIFSEFFASDLFEVSSKFIDSLILKNGTFSEKKLLDFLNFLGYKTLD